MALWTQNRGFVSAAGLDAKPWFCVRGTLGKLPATNLRYGAISAFRPCLGIFTSLTSGAWGNPPWRASGLAEAGLWTQCDVHWFSHDYATIASQFSLIFIRVAWILHGCSLETP